GRLPPQGPRATARGRSSRVLDRGRLERRLAVLHVDREPNPACGVFREDCGLVLLQRALELLEAQPRDRLAALFTDTNVFLVDLLPVVELPRLGRWLRGGRGRLDEALGLDRS